MMDDGLEWINKLDDKEIPTMPGGTCINEKGSYEVVIYKNTS